MNNLVIVDTSIAIKWALIEPDSPKAAALLQEWTLLGTDMLAPMLFAYEITNVLRQRVRKGLMTVNEANNALADIFSGDLLLDELTYAEQVAQSRRALELAHQFNLSTAYDAHYLALAERETCDYWTADERLWNSVKAQLPWVRWLGAYTPPAGQPSIP